MGRDKALIELEGKTLLARAVNLCTLFSNEVLISSDLTDHRVDGAQTIADEIKDCGPMGGIYSCLKKSSNEWNFVFSVDTPFVEADFVRFLISVKENFETVIPVHSGKKEPLIALYHRNVVGEMEKTLKAGDYKMHFLLQKLNANYTEVENWLLQYPDLFLNLNYPGDLGFTKT